MTTDDALASYEQVERIILSVRGHRVILDKDLAAFYGVTTSSLNKAVRRNIEKFPGDFMLRLTADELRDLKLQLGTSSWGVTRKPEHAFTQEGVAMLSSVLRSPRAIEVNIAIMRALPRRGRRIGFRSASLSARR